MVGKSVNAYGLCQESCYGWDSLNMYARVEKPSFSGYRRSGNLQLDKNIVPQCATYWAKNEENLLKANSYFVHYNINVFLSAQWSTKTGHFFKCML